VVKTLCFKPESRGFETRWGELLLLFYLVILWWGVNSESLKLIIHPHLTVSSVLYRILSFGDSIALLTLFTYGAGVEPSPL
jgi:hypothetical protein